MNTDLQNSVFGPSYVTSAYEKIKNYLVKTPLAESLYLNAEDRKYYFKLECNQPVRSFKIRGALNKMLSLSDEARAKGVATVSSGNHGSSVAYAARLLGIERADIIIPGPAPKAKEDRIKFYGGNALRMGHDYDSAHAEGMRYIEEQGLTYIDAYYDDPYIYAGQGTCALEILEQNPDIDTIVVPIGGGGLITGIAVGAKSIKPDIRIVGVQTEACPAMIRALENNIFYEEYPVIGDTVCDALVGGVGKLSFEMLPGLVDDMIEVKESSIRKATAFMIREEKHIVEGGSAIAAAAVMDYPERVGGKNIALIMSGGNIDGDLMVSLLTEN